MRFDYRYVLAGFGYAYLPDGDLKLFLYNETCTHFHY